MSRFSGKQFKGANKEFRRKQREANAARAQWWEANEDKFNLSPEERLLAAIFGPPWEPMPPIFDATTWKEETQ